jgi:hypothetical protein
MFVKKIEEMIRNAVKMSLYDGEDGAAGGGTDVDVMDSSVPPDFDGIPQDVYDEFVKNDEEMREILEADKKDSGSDGDGNNDDNADDDESGDADSDDSNDDDSDDKSDEDTTDEGGDTDTEDGNKDDADDGDGSTAIDGLSDEEFGKMSEDAQGVVAEFYEEAKTAKDELDATKARLDKLLEDPVAKLRDQAIQDGNENALFKVRGVTDEEVQSIVKQFDLVDSDAPEVKAAIEKLAKRMAEDTANNLIIQEKERTGWEATKAQGKSRLLELAKFNKSLELKEADLDKILTQREKHPEWDQYQKGVGKIKEWCEKKGFNYGDVVTKFTPESLYAAAAAELGMPVALNTSERDSKIATDARRSAVERFRKGAKKTLSSKASEKGTSRQDHEKVYLEGGYDVVRLANDPDYYESAVNKKPGDMAHMDKIDRLVVKGERLTKKQKK